MVPLVGLQCVIVLIPDHTRLPFTVQYGSSKQKLLQGVRVCMEDNARALASWLSPGLLHQHRFARCALQAS